MTYSDVMKMPTIERRYFIRKYIEQQEDKAERATQQQEEVKNTGKGQRTRKVSGGAVKQFSGKN